MFSINGDKASGLYGFSTHFFKTTWNIIGDDVVRAILHFFHTNSILVTFNSTCVTLVPKCQNPSDIKDFKPISQCSIITSASLKSWPIDLKNLCLLWLVLISVHSLQEEALLIMFFWLRSWLGAIVELLYPLDVPSK